jgi:hypothetical protein
MTLTKEQKRNLQQMSEYLKKIERLSKENNLDLDVFMTNYTDGDISVYATENVDISSKAEERKKQFQKSENEKSKSITRKE